MQKRIDVKISPARCLGGALQVPGDKSISHRLAMLAALARGQSSVRNFLRGEDCLNTLRAVEALGAQIAWQGDELFIQGGAWHAPARALDMGNSGTGLRLLAGLLAGHPWRSELTGDASLCSRPMERIRAPLELMGVRVELRGARGCAPMIVHGGALHGIEYRLPVASAQVKSCVLLAGLFAEGDTTVHEPLPARDHTEIVLQAMGVDLRVDGPCIRVRGYGAAGPVLPARAWVVPGDFSSAAFWLTAAAAMPEASVVLKMVGVNPRRSALMDILRRMGADIRLTHLQDPAPEPLGDLAVRGCTLHGTAVGGLEIPSVIDELPLVAVAGALARGETLIRDARELRVKESDRIACMAQNLRELGVAVEELPDGMRINGGAPIRGNVRVKSFADHRIAMAMAVLALSAEAPVLIEDVDCVSTSYPGFWDHFRGLGGRAELCPAE